MQWKGTYFFCLSGRKATTVIFVIHKGLKLNFNIFRIPALKKMYQRKPQSEMKKKL